MCWLTTVDLVLYMWYNGQKSSTSPADMEPIREQMKDQYTVQVGPYALLKQNHHIVYWQNDGGKQFHFTLAIFEKTSEGYELRFVGSRPFDYHWDEACTFMEFARVCQKYLDGVFVLEKFQVEHA